MTPEEKLILYTDIIEHDEAFEAGYMAFENKICQIDNPYETETALHVAWDNGWNAAYDTYVYDNGIPSVFYEE